MSASSKAGIPKSKIWGRDRRPQPPGLTHMGPSIKYVTLFLANFDLPSPCHTLSHIPGPPRKYVTHLGPPSRFLVGLVQKPRTKVPYTNSISIVRRGFCQGGFVRVGFVRPSFCRNTSVTTES